MLLLVDGAEGAAEGRDAEAFVRLVTGVSGGGAQPSKARPPMAAVHPGMTMGSHARQGGKEAPLTLSGYLLQNEGAETMVGCTQVAKEAVLILTSRVPVAKPTLEHYALHGLGAAACTWMLQQVMVRVTCTRALVRVDPELLTRCLNASAGRAPALGQN